MSRRSLILAGVLTAVYVVFWIWWGGSGEPLTQQEADAYLARENQRTGARAGVGKTVLDNQGIETFP